MTALQALAILEGATLEWKKRNINTPEVSDARICWNHTFGRSGWFYSFGWRFVEAAMASLT